MQLTHPIFKILSGIAAEKGLEIYVIGGYVRDLILRRPSKDIDIVVLGSGIELAETAAKQLGDLTVSVFKNFGTAMFRYKGVEIEFVGQRDADGQSVQHLHFQPAAVGGGDKSIVFGHSQICAEIFHRDKVVC